MNGRYENGPGDLPLVRAKLDLGVWERIESDGLAAGSSGLGREAGLEYFIEEHLDGPAASRLVLVLDEPTRTGSRALVAFALAAELVRWEKKVLVLDGDDHSPDLTRWIGRQESEGWLDTLRYDVSLKAASEPLPFAPDQGRVMGLGSYGPSRLESEELERFVNEIAADYDHVIVTSTTGDQGAAWAALKSLSVVCWSPEEQDRGAVESIVRDAALLGERPRAVVELEPAAAEDIAADVQAASAAASGSSPVFRRLGWLMGVLIAVLALWWFVVIRDNGGEPTVAAVDPVVQETTAPPATQEPVEIVTDEIAAEETTPSEVDVPATPEPEVETPPEPAVEAVTTAPEPTEDVDVATAETVRDTSPQLVYDTDVGAAGWCLHVSSLRSSELAEDMRDRFAAKGVHARIVTGEDGEGWLWYRLYVGSFPSSDAARAEVPGLCERLGTDWAGPAPASVLH